MSDFVLFNVAIAVFVVAIAWVLWSSASVRLDDVETLEEIGGVGQCDVSIVNADERRMVEFLVTHSDEDGEREVHMYLTASQTLLLSQWIRLAATPGRTLADARRRITKPSR